MGAMVVYIIIGILLGIGVGALYPYLKDFRVTPEEKAKVMEIVVDVTRDILSVATSKSRDQLVLAVTNITMKKLEHEKITGFRRQDIELMAQIIIDKLGGNTAGA